MKTKQQFGGAWTEIKLRILREYVSTYQRALSKQLFSKAYIDAFAGTGYREEVVLRDPENVTASLFENDEPIKYEGSARLILNIKPVFDEYYFIEKSKLKAKELEKLKLEFSSLAERINIVPGEANERLVALCKDKDQWQKKRAVLFLDPFGMSVAWSTLQIIQATHAIDIWYLFPLGMGVNRMLTKHRPKLNSRESKKLDTIFGTHDWIDHFYIPDNQGVFPEFQDEIRHNKVAPMSKQRAYVMSRLNSLFGTNCVAQTPRHLENSKNNLMYLLCFMTSNPTPKASELALRIATSILESS